MNKNNMIFLGFKKYIKKPNTIEYGSLYTKEINIPFSVQKKRILRVFLPHQYDGTKRFPVIYFTDGQNMVDRFTTAFGSWEADTVNEEYAKLGHLPFIFVGLDCPTIERLREAEYMPDLGKTSLIYKACGKYEKYGEKTADFFVNTIKPLIDKTFLTLPEREHTGFAGSSMGGLFSFYISNKYSDVFSFNLSYSPAFLLYKRKVLIKYLSSIEINKVKTVLYCGGKGYLEKAILIFTKLANCLLKKKGFDDDSLLYLYNKVGMHSEKYWHEQLLESFLFIAKGKNI